MFSIRILSAFLIVLATLSPSAAEAATAYVISDSTTGFVLDQSNAQKKLQVASLTKVASAMVVLDWQASTGADLSQQATVPQSAAQLNSQPGLPLQPGDRCSLRDLLYASLMQSDNAAAETLADHVGRALGGSGGDVTPVAAFVQQMNALARAKGMERTRFLNAHGLDTLERAVPFSSAEDMAKLANYAMSNSAFRFYVSQKERKVAFVSPAGEQAYLLRNTNELLGISDIDGVKTGTTKKAGQCLIISAQRAPESVQKGNTFQITPRRINVTVLGSEDRFNEASALLARGWQLYDAWAAAGRPIKGGKRK